MVLALVAAAVGGFVVASCGNSNKGGGDMGADMSGSSAPDMVVTKLNCLAYANCIYNCLPTQNGSVATCQSICDKQAKA
ncbi:MAG TPA: hypothetical protein VF334_03390, partial [Polyangia bacterium]